MHFVSIHRLNLCLIACDTITCGGAYTLQSAPAHTHTHTSQSPACFALSRLFIGSRTCSCPVYHSVSSVHRFHGSFDLRKCSSSFISSARRSLRIFTHFPPPTLVPASSSPLLSPIPSSVPSYGSLPSVLVILNLLLCSRFFVFPPLFFVLPV